MTAEVAIMNTRGIALAADSAVTIGVGKTYNTADKLFALSKHHPVGIMMYSSASIMGIDWEVIIKSYRDFLGNKSFDKLSDYAEDFINYLSKFSYFTQEKMVNYLESMCFDVFSEILTWFLSDLHNEFDGKENIELTQINTVFTSTLKDIHEFIKKSEDEKAIKLDSEFIDSNSKAIQKMLEIVFEDFQLSKKQIADITAILKLVLQKGGKLIDNYTGIVIAGYGEREIFPVVYDFKVSGKLGDSLIYFGTEIDQIGTDHTASIIPYAQSEMVHQFARGMDRDFKDKIIEKVDAILSGLSPLINDPEKEKVAAISVLLEEYLDDHSRKVFVDPIIDIVACMQTSELVSMAEAMVNLTALKRHVSTDEETVGGPVDVAMITRGEGFIWIKRKTNYDPNLNRHLNQKYFRGGEK